MTLTPEQKEQAAKALAVVMWGEVASQAKACIWQSQRDIVLLQKELAKVGLAIVNVPVSQSIMQQTALGTGNQRTDIVRKAIQPIEKEEK